MTQAGVYVEGSKLAWFPDRFEKLVERPIEEAFAPQASVGGAQVLAAPVTEAPKSGTVAASILREAADIVDGDRDTTHGHKERSFTAIARLWTAYLDSRAGLDVGAPVTACDVAQMMVLLKIARTIQGKPIRDHFVDQAGYSATAGELAA